MKANLKSSAAAQCINICCIIIWFTYSNIHYDMLHSSISHYDMKCLFETEPDILQCDMIQFTM